MRSQTTLFATFFLGTFQPHATYSNSVRTQKEAEALHRAAEARAGLTAAKRAYKDALDNGTQSVIDIAATAFAQAEEERRREATPRPPCCVDL